MTIAVAATGDFGAAILDGLAARREIELLLTKPDKPQGRGRKKLAPPAKEVALRHGIDILVVVSLIVLVLLGIGILGALSTPPPPDG